MQRESFRFCDATQSGQSASQLCFFALRDTSVGENFHIKSPRREPVVEPSFSGSGSIDPLKGGKVESIKQRQLCANGYRMTDPLGSVCRTISNCLPDEKKSREGDGFRLAVSSL